MKNQFTPEQKANYCYKGFDDFVELNRNKSLELSNAEDLKVVVEMIRSKSENEFELYLNLYSVYIHFIFSCNENVLRIFEIFGVDEYIICQNDFVDINKLRSVCESLFEREMLFQMDSVISWITAELSHRVFKKLNQKYRLAGESFDYEDRFINSTELHIDNLRRRINYASMTEQIPLEENDRYMFDLQSSFNPLFEFVDEKKRKNMSFLSLIKQKIKYLPLSEQARNKNLHTNPEITVNFILETVKMFSEQMHTSSPNSYSPRSILLAFKPLFHLVYEDNLDGLFSEEAFIRYNETRYRKSEIFDGNYTKYYFSKIETLTHFK